MSVVTGFYRTGVIDGLLEHSPAEYVRRPNVPPESPTLGLTHLQLEALLTAARDSANPNDFALVCLLGLLGLRIFEATGADVEDLGEEHVHGVLRVRGKGGKVVLVPLPPAVARGVDRAVDGREHEPLLRSRRGARMHRHAATRRLRQLRLTTNVRMPKIHPHMLRHTFVTTMPDAGADVRDVQIPPGTPTPGRPCATTAPATTSTGTRTTSSPPTWPPMITAMSGARTFVAERGVRLVSTGTGKDVRPARRWDVAARSSVDSGGPIELLQ